jgi:hypothetical protein
MRRFERWMMIGWNRQSGSGETDFIANSGAGYPGGFAFWNYTNGGALSPLMYLNAQGFVGINTTSPQFPLDVYGDWAVMRQGVWGQSTTAGRSGGYFTGPANASGGIVVQGGNGNWPAFWIMGAQTMLQIGANGSPQPNGGVINITTSGNVLVGKTTQVNSSYMLDVNGNVRANQLVVNTTGADYVFDPGYHLPSLKALATYVRREHHLPDITPAAQMQKDGVDLGANQTKLLAKVEELTLYLIEKDKEVTDLKKRITELEQRNKTLESLEQRIGRLENAGHSGGDK